MFVGDWMTNEVEVVRPEDDIAFVRWRFWNRHVRQFPVVSDGKLVGIITDRDVRSVRDPATQVRSVMTRDPITIRPDTAIEAATALVRRQKVGALPVMEGARLVGIITESDLLQALVELCGLLEPTTVIEGQAQPKLSRSRPFMTRRPTGVAGTSARSDADAG